MSNGPSHWHRHWGSPRRQHRLRTYDELYGYGRFSKPCLAAGIREHVSWCPLLRDVSDDCGYGTSLAVQAREMGRIVVAGHTRPQIVFEIIAPIVSAQCDLLC
jgi:hypothetical protein